MFGLPPLPRNLDAALRDVAHPRAHVRISAIADLVRWAATPDRPRCVQSLSSLLRHDEDDEVRAAAAMALADAEAGEAVDALVQATRASAPRVQQMALLALGEVAPPRHRESLAAIADRLSSDAPALRFQALVAANRLFSIEALVEPLRAAFSASESRVRYLACRIAEERLLSKAGDSERAAADAPEAERSLERLFELVGERLDDDDDDVAIAAALTLARHGSEAAARRLVDALNARSRWPHLDDEQAAVELCAELALHAARPGLRARAWGGLLSGPGPSAFQARIALARMGDDRARRHIVRGLSSWSRRVRTQSAAAAGQARLRSARPVLCAMRGDERRADPLTVEEALRAVGE